MTCYVCICTSILPMNTWTLTCVCVWVDMCLVSYKHITLFIDGRIRKYQDQCTWVRNPFNQSWLQLISTYRSPSSCGSTFGTLRMASKKIVWIGDSHPLIRVYMADMIRQMNPQGFRSKPQVFASVGHRLWSTPGASSKHDKAILQIKHIMYDILWYIGLACALGYSQLVHKVVSRSKAADWSLASQKMDMNKAAFHVPTSLEWQQSVGRASPAI